MYNQPYGVIYQFGKDSWGFTYLPERNLTIVEPMIEATYGLPGRHPTSLGRTLGLGLIALALGGIMGPLTPTVRLESSYYVTQLRHAIRSVSKPNVKPLPPSVPVVFTPLITPEGSSIDPINRDFSLIIPKIGVNAAVIPAVNPADPGQYLEALKKGVAHASTSYFPNQKGTVYLFSHSTNYDWFVKNLNAVFYLLKNLDTNDLVIIYYKNRQYVYKITDKRVVEPTEVSYLVPHAGKPSLILQTCWPVGTTKQRLLIFADLVTDEGQQI